MSFHAWLVTIPTSSQLGSEPGILDSVGGELGGCFEDVFVELGVCG